MRECPWSSSVNVPRELIEQDDEAESPAWAVRPTRKLAAAGALDETLECRADQFVLLAHQLRVGLEPQTGAAGQCHRPRGHLTLAWQRTRQGLAEPEFAYAQSVIHQLTPFWLRPPRTTAQAA